MHMNLIQKLERKILYSVARFLPDTYFFNKIYLAFLYHAFHRRFPNLKNPMSFNEKLMKQLLAESDIVLRAYIADKEYAKDYFREKLGKKYIINTIKVIKNKKDINIIDSIEKCPFIIKPTHLSGKSIIIRKKEDITISVRKKMEQWLSMSHFPRSRQRSYKILEPKIIIEELLLTELDQVPEDIKVFCFHGEPKVFQIDYSRFSGHKRDLFDIEGKLLNFSFHYPRENRKFLLSDEMREQVIALSKKISQPFHFVRVDFYVINSTIKIGEMTFWPENCIGIFEPAEGDKYLGSFLN